MIVNAQLKGTRPPEEELLGQMNYLSSSSCSWTFSSTNSMGAILYKDCAIGLVPMKVSIETSISLTGGNLGNSSRNMSGYSFIIGILASSTLPFFVQSLWI